MNDTLTLAEAGSQLQVAEDDLRRLVRVGKLPEARRSTDGSEVVWVLPTSALGEIAKRHGWTIDLRDGPSSDDRATGQIPVVHKQTLETTPQVDHQAQQRSEELELAQIVDAALLDRLLSAHEEKAVAQVRNREIQENLTATSDAYRQANELLEIERRERAMAVERYRDEQRARQVADAKVAELRERLEREMAGLDGERQARVKEANRSLLAEREAATAIAAMGWISRRRYRRIADQSPHTVEESH